MTTGETPYEPTLSLVVAGHVDHGKSTLIGRLLHDTDALPEGRLEALKAVCARRGQTLEYAFLLDALQAERNQGVTIDSTQIRFRTRRRSYVIIDAPGHRDFLRNMVSGAALADAAVLVIDAHEGMREQSRRHGYLLRLLGLSQVAVAVNKMDLVAWDRQRFEAVAGDSRRYLDAIGITASAVIPIAAREGAGLTGPSDRMPWHDGPSLIDALDTFTPPPAPAGRPLRLPVQDVYRFDGRRIVVGRVESGQFAVGAELLFSPSNARARVRTIEAWNAADPVTAATAGQSVGITLEDPVFVERGHLASGVTTPPAETNIFGARVFWLGRQPLAAGQHFMMKLNTGRYAVEVQSVSAVIDVDSLSRNAGGEIPCNGVGEIVLRARATIPLDDFRTNPETGRFVLVDAYDTVGGGIVIMDGFPDQRARYDVASRNIAATQHAVDTAARARANGHRNGILWLTGLSGAGKSTLAVALERQLFHKGWQVYVLDGDNMRFGLSSDLGFSPDDRVEHIRRVGEVSKLFASAGFLVVAAFISPYRRDRDRVRAVAPDVFHEIHVKADLAICEQRDPKGLYARARRGEIGDFTGISAPYEAPLHAELTVDTSRQSVDESVAALMAYVAGNFALDEAAG